MKIVPGCALGFMLLMGCGHAPSFGPDERSPSVQLALIRAIQSHYIEVIDVSALLSLSVPEIMARLDRDSSLREVEPSSLDFIRGFEQEGSVSRLTMLSNKIGYLRIGFFGRRTVQDVRGALEGLTAYRCPGLIIDLRDNPGGRMETAIEVAGLFLPKGVPPARYRGRGAEERSYASTGSGRWTGPAMILINRGTASSAELFAGLLRYYHMARLLGTPTAGKSTVQAAIPLDHRRLLLLTTGRYLFPNGSTVAAAGLQPDVTEERDGELIAKAQSMLVEEGMTCEVQGAG